jgi:hypothetical protein
LKVPHISPQHSYVGGQGSVQAQHCAVKAHRPQSLSLRCSKSTLVSNSTSVPQACPGAHLSTVDGLEAPAFLSVGSAFGRLEVCISLTMARLLAGVRCLRRYITHNRARTTALTATAPTASARAPTLVTGRHGCKNARQQEVRRPHVSQAPNAARKCCYRLHPCRLYSAM